MGEQIYCSLNIGGTITRDGIARLAKEIRETMTHFECADPAIVLLANTKDGEFHNTISGYVNWGNADPITTVMDELGLSYRVHCASGSNIDAEVITCVRDKHGDIVAIGRDPASETDSPMISLADLRRAQRAGVTFQDVIDTLGIHDTAVPPLTLKDV